MKNFCLALLGGAMVLALAVSPALAHAPFKKAFEDLYVKNGSDALKASFEKAGCNACHVKDEKKDVRNAYGMALDKALLEGDLKELLKTDKEKVMKSLDEAFSKVEAQKSAGGKTYGELIKSGMLP